MRRPRLTIAVSLAALCVLALAVILTVTGGDAEFDEADAEAAVREALVRCRHELADAKRIECRDVGVGFACRADGRFVGGFDAPDAEQPQLSVVC